MTIRDERPGDAPGIAKIHYAAFKGHPVHPPGAEPVEHLIVERLRAARALRVSLLAEEDGLPAGHVALSPASVGREREGWLLLGPVGVVPDLQGLGIGSALVRAALARAEALGARGVALVGEPGYYARFGFATAPGLTYPGVPAPYVLAVALRGDPPRGDIAAHEAFSVTPG
ncbi:hypothetical protein NNJEOMEG_03165 [Fundidesulfovibrio magnetotacticus]|uniref:N-acetyltransferase domain-containing protein n=1 Tax=Fundidesulfovibrio magnetotacticus TaxID=2730080 RepID=A0A6V8LZU9_9BACT|nr:N-acetyltransferase [Fundidesulfovibrio magnetotacticus]GFK95306.1 hypothetical protein NNJEOMEG_03165 [Fundidesulfovibrio magnetotacticus]